MKKGNALLDEAIEYARSEDSGYWDLVARKVVDMTIDIFISYEFLKQAERAGDTYPEKVKVARRFIRKMLPKVEMNRQYVMSGDRLEL